MGRTRNGKRSCSTRLLAPGQQAHTGVEEPMELFSGKRFELAISDVTSLFDKLKCCGRCQSEKPRPDDFDPSKGCEVCSQEEFICSNCDQLFCIRCDSKKNLCKEGIVCDGCAKKLFSETTRDDESKTSGSSGSTAQRSRGYRPDDDDGLGDFGGVKFGALSDNAAPGMPKSALKQDGAPPAQKKSVTLKTTKPVDEEKKARKVTKLWQEVLAECDADEVETRIPGLVHVPPLSQTEFTGLYSFLTDCSDRNIFTPDQETEVFTLICDGNRDLVRGYRRYLMDHNKQDLVHVMSNLLRKKSRAEFDEAVPERVQIKNPMGGKPKKQSVAQKRLLK